MENLINESKYKTFKQCHAILEEPFGKCLSLLMSTFVSCVFFWEMIPFLLHEYRLGLANICVRYQVSCHLEKLPMFVKIKIYRPSLYLFIHMGDDEFHELHQGMRYEEHIWEAQNLCFSWFGRANGISTLKMNVRSLKNP